MVVVVRGGTGERSSWKAEEMETWGDGSSWKAEEMETWGDGVPAHGGCA